MLQWFEGKVNPDKRQLMVTNNDSVSLKGINTSLFFARKQVRSYFFCERRFFYQFSIQLLPVNFHSQILNS